MDKNEYRETTEQMLECINGKQYEKAVELADGIDWKKVKNVTMLCAASEIYEYTKDYEKSQELLMAAYERSPESRKIVYRLAALALKLDDVQEAVACYEEFVEMAPKDPNQYILRYKILKKKGEPIEKQIEALEEFKKTEYVEKWAFELAKLYHEAGMTAECLEECDDLILWFSEGKFVYRAMELKMQYKPLTPLQQEKYDQKEQPKVAEVVPVEEVQPEAEAPAPAEEEKPDESIEVAEEPIEVAEEPIEIEDEPTEEQKSPTSDLSIQEMLQNWEEKQKENAKMIQAEQERVQKEQEAEPKKEAEEEESVLPDDIRLLMEELETESSEIYAQKISQPPKKAVTSRIPDLSAVAETITEVTGAIGAAVVSAASAVVSTETAAEKVAEKAAESVVQTTAEKIIQETEDVAEKEVEKEQGIQLGNTQDMMLAAKALLNDEIVETPEAPEESEEQPQARSKYDTGFVVQGRYDLEAQSDVGTKAGLTEDQKRLFSYFVPVHGMSEQIVDVLDKDRECRARYGTSRIGNVLIVGRKGSGKTVLAVNMIKAIQKTRRAKSGKLAIVTAEDLNKKDVSQILDKLYGGAIVIEKASRLNKRTITRLNDLMEEQTGELLFVLEDERKNLDKMLAANPRFSKKFTSRVELPVFINDELVTFGQTYAKENGYKIDEMGILALYTHIDMLQRDEEVVTVADVKEIIDIAIEHSRKLNVKHIAKKLFGKAKDESDRVLLTEEDFKL